MPAGVPRGSSRSSSTGSRADTLNPCPVGPVVVGFLVLGIDGLRRPGARWLALLPLVTMLVAIGADDRGGFLLLGAAWGALAVGGAATGRGEEAAQPA
ncbi:MAG TPA: hypothetical protein VGK78_17785 [Nocardioides sp.]|uniref:hypothetical protein n=1 Tax=Nocardioides sp. TaxID=35761 RepID=UPI002F40CE22